MRTMIEISLLSRSLFLTVLVFFLCGAACIAMDERPERHVVGGPCQYKAYPGRAAILSVQKQEGQTQDGAPDADAYEVKFSFTPGEEIEEDWVRVEGKEHLLLLTNSSFPGPRFLKRYGIEPGKCFECYLKVITRGTCTPVLFDFPYIDLSDYSEME
jgi:hypothetical protein